ncbi:hypothetical protein PT974_03519 [Cladobotryum mycophilum]|uniref:Uncharacterized protein n=1 Tax=Cladobotryum mycophilum TaxID=491253 RepID=A0ABR0SSI1_9HYPO
MSTNTRLFESGLATPPVTPCLDALIRKHLEIAARDIVMNSSHTPPSPPSEPPSASNAGLVNEMGDYLIRTAMLWSQLTENLMQGSHIDLAALEILEQTRTTTHCADLTAVAAMDASLSRLRKIRDLTAKFSRDVQAIWRPEPYVKMESSPVMQTIESPCLEVPSVPHSISVMGNADPRNQRLRRGPPENILAARPQGREPSESEESGDDDDDDEEQFSRIDMEALRQRGKGTYYCPKGQRCDKGGVDKDGHLVLFDRNSSFAYVVDTPPAHVCWTVLFR